MSWTILIPTESNECRYRFKQYKRADDGTLRYVGIYCRIINKPCIEENCRFRRNSYIDSEKEEDKYAKV